MICIINNLVLIIKMMHAFIRALYWVTIQGHFCNILWVGAQDGGVCPGPQTG